MFIPNDQSNVGKRVVLLEDVSTMAGTFHKGHEMTIIAEGPRGWDLCDDQGNKICEAGMFGHKEFKLLD